MSIDDIKKKLQEDLRIAKKATPGPFEVPYGSAVICEVRHATSEIHIAQTKSNLDARFFSHARNTYEANTRALLVAIEALEDAIPNGYRGYKGEEACKAVLGVVDLTVKAALAEIAKILEGEK